MAPTRPPSRTRADRDGGARLRASGEGPRVSWLRLGGRDYAVLSVPAPAAQLPRTLTAAERAVAAMVARGESNAQIARRRGTSARTVANQIASVFRKLGVASRAELAARLGRGG